MVNVEKHKALKIFNKLTESERLIRQVKNRKKYYNKTKFKAHAEAKHDKKNSAKLEALSYKV